MNKRSILIAILLVGCSVSPKQKAREILQAGIKDESAIIRVNAAIGLQQIGDTVGIRVLREVLNGNNRDGVTAAIDALYDSGSQPLSQLFIRFTENEDPLIRTEAYRLITIIDDVKYRDILIKGTHDNISKIRRISYLGLGKFKEEKIIHNGLRDIDPLVRIASAHALGNLGEKGMANIIKMEMKINNIEICQQSIIALAEIGDTSAIPFIKGFLTDAPWDLRITAVEALLILKNLDGIEVLKQGLKSNDPFVRVKCVEILKRFTIPEFHDLLKEATADEYINVSLVAIQALNNYHKKEDKQIFEKLMEASSPLVKIAAAGAYLRD